MQIFVLLIHYFLITRSTKITYGPISFQNGKDKVSLHLKTIITYYVEKLLRKHFDLNFYINSFRETTQKFKTAVTVYLQLSLLTKTTGSFKLVVHIFTGDANMCGEWCVLYV